MDPEAQSEEKRRILALYSMIIDACMRVNGRGFNSE